MEFSVTFFSAEFIILLLYTWKYKIYFIKDIWICLWTSGNEVYHKEKWPEFSRWSAPTHRDRRTNKRMYSYSFFGANNNKVSKFRTSNCTEETGDWTLMHSTARSFNHILAFHWGISWAFIFGACSSHTRVLKPVINIKRLDFFQEKKKSQTNSTDIQNKPNEKSVLAVEKKENSSACFLLIIWFCWAESLNRSYRDSSQGFKHCRSLRHSWRHAHKLTFGLSVLVQRSQWY